MSGERTPRRKGRLLAIGLALATVSLLAAGCAAPPARASRSGERRITVGQGPQERLIDPGLPDDVKMRMRAAM